MATQNKRLVLSDLKKNLPDQILDKIFLFKTLNPVANIFKNYCASISIYLDDHNTFDFDYYMTIQRKYPIIYSYYRDITYNKFHSLHSLYKKNQKYNKKQSNNSNIYYTVS